MTWSRRNFLWTPLVVATACGGKVENDMAEPPWHLWGQTADLNLRAAVGAAPQEPQSNQLINVRYKRPDTWSFFFFAQIASATPGIAVGDLAINVDFQISFGVGLNRFVDNPRPSAPTTTGFLGQQGFVRFGWRRVLNDNIKEGSLKWSQTATTPLLDENDPDSARREINYIPAQSIQVDAIASIPLLGGPPGTVQEIGLKVGAFFAPLSHVRPDWFAMEGVQFSGNETGGK